MKISAADDKKTVAGIVLLRKDFAALLQLRDDKSTIQDPGIWVIPGGHIEPGESILEGARREFLEETCYASFACRPLAQFNSLDLGYSEDFGLAFFWEAYDGLQKFECREGQALQFILRPAAETIPKRSYLTLVWDLAINRLTEIEKNLR